jgi:hypothetical protein
MNVKLYINLKGILLPFNVGSVSSILKLVFATRLKLKSKSGECLRFHRYIFLFRFYMSIKKILKRLLLSKRNGTYLWAGKFQ